MDKELIWPEPVDKEMIWGRETWTISAHPHGDCTVSRGRFKGMKLSEVWRQYPEVFGAKAGGPFPLLTKIIDAREDLSIQVHPDDAYAKEHENGSLGKTECWYIIDCKENASIVLGHHAKDKQELETMIRNGRWADFIREVPVKKGDFFQIEPGCLHAVKGGIRILETQQNSDITYRVYDYNRLSDGKPRELHLRQSLDVIKAPFQESPAQPETEDLAGAEKTHLITCPYYQVYKYQVKGSFRQPFSGGFTNVTVIEGSGFANGVPVEAGAAFIVPAGTAECEFAGEFSYITAIAAAI